MGAQSAGENADSGDHGRARWQRRYDASRLRDADFTTLSGVAVDPVNGPFPQAHGELVTDLPSTPSCTTTIVKGARFQNSAYGPDGAWSGSYTPTCNGPWSKVVVTMSAYVRSELARPSE